VPTVIHPTLLQQMSGDNPAEDAAMPNPNDHAPPDLIGQLSAELAAARTVLAAACAAYERWDGAGEAGPMIEADRALRDAHGRARQLLAETGA
jgi:hypothetical protein